MTSPTRGSLPDLSKYDEDEPAAEATLMFEAAVVAPRGKQVPSLVVTSGASTLGMIFILRGEMLLGRSAGCDVLLSEQDVSRKHATLAVRPDGRVDVVDLDSSNGVFHREKRVKSVTLGEGDKLRIGRATLTVVLMDDVGEVVQRNHLVVTTRDPATGLHGRRHFRDMLGSELGDIPRLHPAALVCFSVDAFETIVDASGRATADDVIRRLGIVASEVVSSEDAIVALIADDEVALLLPGRTQAEALVTAEWIRSSMGAFAAPPIGVSAGIAMSTDEGIETTDALLTSAWRALRFAQASGGGQLCTWASLCAENSTAPPRPSKTRRPV